MSNRRLLVPSALLALTLGACASGGHEHAYTYTYTPPADPIAQEAAFLAKNAKTRGVITLPGLQYMVLQSGPADGPHPKRSDDITVRYEGRFLNGKVFNTSPNGGQDTITFPLEKLIPGWGAALQMMRPGDVWMLYIPANLAYGEAGKGYIPPYSTLIFRVELVAVAPPPEPAPPAPAQQPTAAVTAVPIPPPPPPPPPPASTATPPGTATTEAPPPAKSKPAHHRKRPKPKPAEDGSDAGASSEDKDASGKSIFPGSER